MTKRQKAKANMYGLVLQYLDETAPPVPFSTALSGVIASFRDKMESLGVLERSVLMSIKGITERKKAVRQDIANHFSAMAGILHAFACLRQDNELRVCTDFCHSDFIRMRDNDLSTRCRSICGYAEENLAFLADFGVTSSRLDELKALSDDFEKNYLAPREAMVSRAVKRRMITELVEGIGELLHNIIDRLMLAYRLEDGGYHQGYLICRSIIDPAHTATCVKGVVTGAESGEPLAEVAITIENAEHRFDEVSGLDGSYNIKVPQPGIYRIHFSKDGYDTVSSDSLQVMLGKRNRKDIQLGKNGELKE